MNWAINWEIFSWVIAADIVAAGLGMLIYAAMRPAKKRERFGDPP